MNQPATYSATPLQAIRGLRKLVVGIPALREAATAMVGGDAHLIWVPIVAASGLMLHMLEAGALATSFGQAHADNAAFAVAIALTEAGVPPEPFYKALPGFVDLVRQHTMKAVSSN